MPKVPIAKATSGRAADPNDSEAWCEDGVGARIRVSTFLGYEKLLFDEPAGKNKGL
jgi:hypothetical protein